MIEKHLDVSSRLNMQVATYLHSQSHSFGDSRLGKNGLNVGHQFTAQPPALWTNQIALLLNAGNHGKVQGEVSGDDPTNPFLFQLLLSFQFYGWIEQNIKRGGRGRGDEWGKGGSVREGYKES